MVFFRAKSLSRIWIWIDPNIVYVRIVCLFGIIKVGFLENAFVFVLAIVIILCIGFLKPFYKWKTEINGSDFHIVVYIFLQRVFVVFILIVVCFCSLSAYIGLDFLQSTINHSAAYWKSFMQGFTGLWLIGIDFLRNLKKENWCWVSWERCVCINLSCFVNYFIFIFG